MPTRQGQPATTPAPIHPQGGRWFLVFIGLATAAIGALFCWLMAKSFLRARDMRSWPEVPCVILSSTIEERRHDPQSPVEFRHHLTFGYEWNGTPKTSDRFSLRGDSWTSKPNVAEKRLAQWPVGKTTTCRVHPHNPDFALLKPDSLAPGYSIWFPALFVAGGLVMAARALRPPPAPRVSTLHPPSSLL